MKLHELIAELSSLVTQNEANMYKDVVVEDLVPSGFYEDIENVKMIKDPFTDESIVVLGFRSQ